MPRWSGVLIRPGTSAQGRHEGAGFATRQAAGKAVKALHLHLGQEAWGCVVAKLVRELPSEVVLPGASGKRPISSTMHIFPFAIPIVTLKESRLSTVVLFKARRRFDMPVRSLNSSVLKWPNAEGVDRAVRRWAQEIAHKRLDIIRIEYARAYARGGWGREQPHRCSGAGRASAHRTYQWMECYTTPGAGLSPNNLHGKEVGGSSRTSVVWGKCFSKRPFRAPNTLCDSITPRGHRSYNAVQVAMGESVVEFNKLEGMKIINATVRQNMRKIEALVKKLNQKRFLE